MNGEGLLTAFGYVDDELLKRYAEDTKRGKRRNVRVKWGALAACVSLMLAGVLVFALPFNRVANLETYKPSGTVVAEGVPAGSTACYAAPANGKWFCTLNVTGAFKEYAGKDVTYFLTFDIFSDSKAMDVKSQKVAKELQRLSRLGYHVGYAEAWVYGDEKGEHVPYTLTAGFFTAKEIQTFMANKKYGYMFCFATNSDGSPVSFEQGIVSQYDWGKS